MTALFSVARTHLARVYAVAALLLAIWGGSAALAVHHQLRFEGTAIVAVISLAVALVIARMVNARTSVQLALACASAAASGMFLERLIDRAVDVDPSLVATALGGASTIYLSFTLVALLADDATYIYVRGTIASLSLSLLFLAITNWFVPTAEGELVILYGGLVVCGGYVAFDTHEIIERVDRRGEKPSESDVVFDALTLFSNFCRVFYRVLELLIKQGEEEKQKKKNTATEPSVRRSARTDARAART